MNFCNLWIPSYFWTIMIADSSVRDHCILGQTFNALSPHFWSVCEQRVFFYITQMTKLRNGLHNINKQNNFCYKKQVVYSGLWFMQHLKWGDEVMKRVSPRIQCSMAQFKIVLLQNYNHIFWILWVLWYIFQLKIWNYGNFSPNFPHHKRTM